MTSMAQKSHGNLAPEMAPPAASGTSAAGAGIGRSAAGGGTIDRGRPLSGGGRRNGLSRRVEAAVRARVGVLSRCPPAVPRRGTMKPDKPTKDRDILRAHCAKPLKASTQPVASSSSSSPSSSSSGEASSSSQPAEAPGGEASSGEDSRGAEMRLYLDKLRELVPTVPRSGKLSRVRLIHSAIDYITDLQEALEARTRRKLRDKQGQPPRQPLAALAPAQVETNTPRASPLSETSANRLPSTSGRIPPTPAAMELGRPAPSLLSCLPSTSSSSNTSNILANRSSSSSSSGSNTSNILANRSSSSSSSGSNTSSSSGSSGSSGSSSSSSSVGVSSLAAVPGSPQDPC